MNLEQLMALADKEPDEALRIASSRLDEQPNDVAAIFIAWKAYMAAERWGLSYNLMKRALEISPNDPGIWNNVGMSLHGMMRTDDAEKFFRRALSIDPKNVPAMNNLALICVGNHKPEEAIHWADKSLSIDPKPDKQSGVMESRGYASLMLGRWKEGWDGYEACIGGTYRPIASYHGEPYWKGEPVQTLRIEGEQGIGDEISFGSI